MNFVSSKLKPRSHSLIPSYLVLLYSLHYTLYYVTYTYRSMDRQKIETIRVGLEMSLNIF